MKIGLTFTLMAFIFLIFLLGVVRILITYRKQRDLAGFLKIVMVCIFFFPFTLYLLAGLVNIKFGHERNFFYLLPIYLLVLFYGLEAAVRNRRYYYAIVGAVLIILLCRSAFTYVARWSQAGLERTIARCVANINIDPIIIISDIETSYTPLRHYLRQYNMLDKVELFSRDFLIHPVPGLLKAKTFVIVDVADRTSPVKRNIYELGQRRFAIINTQVYETTVGPRFLDYLMKFSQPRIVVYFVKGNVHH